MPYKTVESFMNLRKAITLVITGAFLLTSALFAEEINVHGGNQWRPNVHVDDVAKAIIRIIEAPLEKVE